MARADVKTIIPLDRIAWQLGINPYHFNGISTLKMPLVNTCDDDWYQYDWQTAGKISRESLAYALRQAEDSLALYTHWQLLPEWHIELIPITTFFKPERMSYLNARLDYKSVQTNYAFVRELGQRASAIVATPAIVWVDVDLDTFTETARITFATTVTDAEELRCYYPGKGGLDTWEIRPVTSVTIAAGVATIDIPRYLLALWELQTAIPTPDNPHIIIDGDNDANFLTEIEVRRVYTDTTVVLEVQYPPEYNCATNDCAITYDDTCAYIRNERLGFVAWKPLFDCNYSVPPQVRVYYRAGWENDTVIMPEREVDPMLERMVSFFALSLLDTELCGCANTRNIWQTQTRDIAYRPPEGGSYAALWQDLANPFGTTFAAITLWKKVKDLKVQQVPSRSV